MRSGSRITNCSLVGAIILFGGGVATSLFSEPCPNKGPSTVTQLSPCCACDTWAGAPAGSRCYVYTAPYAIFCDCNKGTKCVIGEKINDNVPVIQQVGTCPTPVPAVPPSTTPTCSETGCAGLQQGIAFDLKEPTIKLQEGCS